jgi:hypothetical protein
MLSKGDCSLLSDIACSLSPSFQKNPLEMEPAKPIVGLDVHPSQPLLLVLQIDGVLRAFSHVFGTPKMVLSYAAQGGSMGSCDERAQLSQKWVTRFLYRAFKHIIYVGTTFTSAKSLMGYDHYEKTCKGE